MRKKQSSLRLSPETWALLEAIQAERERADGLHRSQSDMVTELIHLEAKSLGLRAGPSVKAHLAKLAMLLYGRRFLPRGESGPERPLEHLAEDLALSPEARESWEAICDWSHQFGNTAWSLALESKRH